MGTNLWRNRHDRSNTDESLNTVNFSVEAGIVGVDWDVEVRSDETLNWDQYENRADEAGYSDKQSWVRALRAIHEHMNEGDLCYTRNQSGQFYLGRVTGPWRYETGSEYLKHELVNVRDCDWYRIHDPEETIPTELLESFGRGAVLQRIQDERLVAFSQRLFEIMDGRGHYDIDLPYTMDNWLSDDDLKDLLALYLQADEDQVLLPSSVDQEPFLPDGITVNKLSADRTLYQVQHQHENLPPGAYGEDNRRIIFLQRGNESLDNLPDHVEVLQLEDLTTVFEDHWDLLPRRIRIIADTLKDRGSLGSEQSLPDSLGATPEDDESSHSTTRSAMYAVAAGLAGFLLGLALMASSGYWTGTPDDGTLRQERIAMEQKLNDLRTNNETLADENNELQKTVAELKSSGESASQATQAPESNWVTIRVRQDDTLSELLDRFQGSQNQQDEVVNQNNIRDRDLIYAGSSLSFPSRTTAEMNQMAKR